MKLKKLLSLLTAAGMCLVSVPLAPELLPEAVLTANAAEQGLLGPDHRWTLDDEGTLTITGTGPMRNFDIHYSSPFSWNENIKRVVVSEGVTSIADNLFKNDGGEIQSNIISVTLPDTVTSIGAYAFYNCTNLAEINIPDSVTSIGAAAFFGCKSLTEIKIPEGVTSIADYTFFGCENLASVTIPSSVTSFGEYAFRQCKSLASVTIPDNVTNIGDYAFSDCDNLASVTIPTV